jgi:3-dehydroquinate dehydratase-2
MKILLVNGPNMGRLGKREPEIYGRRTLAEIVADLRKAAAARGAELVDYQSDVEGELVRRIGQAQDEGFDGIIINPGAYTHTSVALRDALAAACVPAVEVHLSNVSGREEFRKVLITTPICRGMVCGLGEAGYTLALNAFCDGAVR